MLTDINRPGLPPLGNYTSTGTAAGSTSVKYAPPTTILKEFGLWSVAWVRGKRAAIRMRERRLFDYSTEADIERLACMVLEDIIQGLGVGEALSLRSQVTVLGGLRPDVYVLAVSMAGGTVPVGVGEVKKSSAEAQQDVDNGHALGQLAEYMSILRDQHGVEHVFGIISTYSRWRICWLPESEAVATSTTPPAAFRKAVEVLDPVEKLCPRAPVELGVTPASPRQSGGDARLNEPELLMEPEPELEPEPKAANTPLTLHCSRIYGSDDPEIVPALATALLKMLSTPFRAPPPRAQPGSMTTFVSSSSSTVARKAVPEGFTLKWGAVSANRATSFYLLESLGDGRDGQVRLAASTGGRVCVLKFLKNGNDGGKASLADAQKEAVLWKTVWGLHANSVMLAGRPTVVMPYLAPIKNEEWNDEATCSLVVAAVGRMAKAGLHHDDLKRRHVGLFLHDGVLEAAFFDLSAVSAARPDNATARSRMLEALGLTC